MARIDSKSIWVEFIDRNINRIVVLGRIWRISLLLDTWTLYGNATRLPPPNSLIEQATTSLSTPPLTARSALHYASLALLSIPAHKKVAKQTLTSIPRVLSTTDWTRGLFNKCNWRKSFWLPGWRTEGQTFCDLSKKHDNTSADRIDFVDIWDPSLNTVGMQKRNISY